jgi:hypothetical protein
VSDVRRGGAPALLAGTAGRLQALLVEARQAATDPGAPAREPSAWRAWERHPLMVRVRERLRAVRKGEPVTVAMYEEDVRELAVLVRELVDIWDQRLRAEPPRRG